MIIFLLLVGVIAGAGLTYWLITRSPYIKGVDFYKPTPHKDRDSSALLYCLTVRSPRVRAASLGIFGVALLVPRIIKVELRRQVKEAVDELEKIHAHLGARVSQEPSRYALGALGELTAELTNLRVAATQGSAEGLGALLEKIARWRAQVALCEKALFGLGKLLREVQELLARVCEVCADEALAQSLQELAAKVEEYGRVEVSFLRPEVMRTLIIELTHARQLLKYCLGETEEDNP